MKKGTITKKGPYLILRNFRGNLSWKEDIRGILFHAPDKGRTAADSGYLVYEEAMSEYRKSLKSLG